MIGVGVLTLLLSVRQDISPGFLLARNPRACITDRVGRRHLRGRKWFDLIIRSLKIIFNIQVGKKVTPLFFGQGTIVFISIHHLILCGCLWAVFGCNTNLILREIYFPEN